MVIKRNNKTEFLFSEELNFIWRKCFGHVTRVINKKGLVSILVIWYNCRVIYQSVHRLDLTHIRIGWTPAELQPRHSVGKGEWSLITQARRINAYLSKKKTTKRREDFSLKLRRKNGESKLITWMDVNPLLLFKNPGNCCSFKFRNC